VITERGNYVTTQGLCLSRDRAPHRAYLRDLLRGPAMDAEASKELATTAHITAIETSADRTGDTGELAFLAPAAAAALRLLADAIQRGTDHDIVVQALKDGGVHEAFADVLDSAAAAVMNGVDDPYDFDERLEADNLSGAASQVRDALRWL
jgi:hypothetical protein